MHNHTAFIVTGKPPRRAQAIHHRIPQSKKEKSAETYLPLLHIILLCLILLRQLLEDLVHVVRVGLELRQDVADGALDQHAVDHAEAFAVAGERCEGFENQSGEGFVSSEFQEGSTVMDCECRAVGDGAMLAFFGGICRFLVLDVVSERLSPQWQGHECR